MVAKSFEQEKIIPKLKAGAKQSREIKNSEKNDLKFQNDSKKITKEALKEKYPEGLCSYCKYFNNNICWWESGKVNNPYKNMLKGKEMESNKVTYCEVFLLPKNRSF